MNSTSPLPEFRRYQLAFTAHLRDPKTHPRPAGVPARGMKVYSELLYNNLEGFLLACFPVLKQTLGARRWNRLCREFFRTHRCHTPYFRQISDEFLQFLQDEWKRPDGYPEWVLELAHYEWVELALSVSNRVCEDGVDPAGDLLDGVPVLNPVLANLAYRWPVQRIGPRVRVVPAATCLLVFRDSDERICFKEINAFGARLIALLGAGTLSGRAALERLAKESGHPDPAVLLAGGAELLRGLRAEGALLGTRR